MKRTDQIAQAWDNLVKTKLRTFLTTSGVMIGTGSLICMMAFGQGAQHNIKQQFDDLGLFNYIVVSHERETSDPAAPEAAAPPLDEALIESLCKLPHVEGAYPELRFPAMVRIGEIEQFTLVQVLPAQSPSFSAVPIIAGETLSAEDPQGAVVSMGFLRQRKHAPPASHLGASVEIRTLTLDFSLESLMKMVFSQRRGLPIGQKDYAFHVRGVSSRAGMGGSIPIRSEVIIGMHAAAAMDKLEINSLVDFFNSDTAPGTYNSITVQVDSPTHVDAVRDILKQQGFQTFAMLDQMEEMKQGFIIMDLFLLAIGMIGTLVSSLGIVNTMVMTVMERYREIGVMKAVGAPDRDIRAIFIVESGLIGLIGGLMGLLLAWVASLVINLIVNAVGVRQGMSPMAYFTFPLWLCISGVGLAIFVSIIAGLAPAQRAASVDPVSALRHD
ncbi:MAG: ABC transporter permease [Pontiellaceae bacterium]|nr:ABC transporter permease [Pontiellaceae bacterium]